MPSLAEDNEYVKPTYSYLFWASAYFAGYTPFLRILNKPIRTSKHPLIHFLPSRDAFLITTAAVKLKIPE